MAILSIFIPTYNRNTVLLENLSKLLPQLTHDCRVVVQDNCSDVPVAETLRELLTGYKHFDISVERNAKNIGGNANISRCFERCETEWLWVLGDDDTPNQNAVALALAAVREVPSDCIYQNFSTIGTHQRDLTYSSSAGLELFLRELDSISNCMFISSCLFRVRDMRRDIQHGFNFAATNMPHLLVAMLAIKRVRGTARFHKAALVTHGDAEGGVRQFVIIGHLGFGLLCSLPLFDDEERRQLRARIATEISAKALVAHIAFGRVNGEISYRGARMLISRCAGEAHYRLADKALLIGCAIAGAPMFSLFGCHLITKLVDRLQEGRKVRIQHVSHRNM